MSIVLLSQKCSHSANKLSLTLLIQICQSVSVQRLVARHLQPLLLQLCLLLHLQHTEKADDIWSKWVQTQQRSANWDCIRFVCGITPCGSCKKESVKLTKRCPWRGRERDPHYSHVGGQHSTEAPGGQVQKWRPSSDPLYRHIWCVTLNSWYFWLLLAWPSSVLPRTDAFTQIISNEGVGTLWNGTLPSLILVLNPAVQFMFYEAMKRRAGREGRKVRGQKWPMGDYTFALFSTMLGPVNIADSTLRVLCDI